MKKCKLSVIKPEKQIFFGVFSIGFLVQLLARSLNIGKLDRSMWADQICYLLTRDQRVFDFHAAYGHPGTTLLEMGGLLHLVFGFSYDTSLLLSESILIASASAICSVICFLLYRNTPWWLAAAFVLLFNRLYLDATPTTAVVMPLIVLMVLGIWWLWEQKIPPPNKYFFLAGCLTGVAAATRYDVTLLVSGPMFMLIWYRYRYVAALSLLGGAGISFYVANPFLWFMPIQHLKDLVYKFTVHYDTRFYPGSTDISNWLDSLWLSVVSFSWAIVLFFRHRLGKIVPTPIISVFIAISFVAVIGLFSAEVKLARYLFPLSVAWEVLLPLFALVILGGNSPSVLQSSSETVLVTRTIIVLAALTQILRYLPLLL